MYYINLTLTYFSNNVVYNFYNLLKMLKILTVRYIEELMSLTFEIKLIQKSYNQ